MNKLLSLTWDRCGRCGGDLPLIDGDNDCGAPSITGGDCPGHQSPGGNCGCYDDDALATWVESLDSDDDECEEVAR